MSNTKELKRANWYKFQEDLTNHIWQIVHDDTIEYLDNCGIYDDLFDEVDDYDEFVSNVMERAVKTFATHQLYPDLDPPKKNTK